MSVDEELIRRHQRFEDPVAGFSEEFVQPVLGPGRTVGVLSRPLTDASHMAWVICHSFGIEQIHLGRLDVIVARALASAGFPVFRFHGQGYGDAEHGMDVVSLGSHLTETIDAVEFVHSKTGVDKIGVLGARFGGTVAALVADRLDLPSLVMWEPMVKGSQFMKELLRSQILAEIVETGRGGGAADLQRIQEDLAREGRADIKGFALTKAAHDEIGSVDLLADVSRFRGAALVVGLSRSIRPSALLMRLVARLGDLGAAVSFQAVQDAFAPQFGQFRWRTVDGGRSKRDTQLELNERIAEITLAWIRSDVQPALDSVDASR
jgi:pimeloyl-ACP methyl ester carboxylesterase